MVLLYTTDKGGNCFIRTDQLDGETDWKMRRPVTSVQNKMVDYTNIGEFIDCFVKCEDPTNKIYDFTGTFNFPSKPQA
jgi:phospholipid-translocating ATPase